MAQAPKPISETLKGCLPNARCFMELKVEHVPRRGCEEKSRHVKNGGGARGSGAKLRRASFALRGVR